ncbi:tetratricopeptide repeat protein [Woeseia oceani]|uniref:tetratricopeptide repeat protein n=1 Tax=Woeseia oceani TaxID=1548547 RepID=UPI000B050266|nr:tetratricopeptide repeat protein [Woeseia oceani]
MRAALAVCVCACIGLFIAEASAADVAVRPQAVSLLGQPLYSAPPSAEALEQLAEAQADYERDPDDADNIIWYGRRIAYTGDYHRAIEVFGEGIVKHPHDARMYRHRGHRYISIRKFDHAIKDFERAVELIDGQPNEIEPDGLPNAMNMPISTLHGNIWYHLGLAYYLQHDWENALRAYDTAYAVGDNDDNKVSTTHWRYMILRRMGRDAEARQVLTPITADMTVIENDSYHQLCLFYKGELSYADIMGENADTPGGSAVGYGIANWLYYSGETSRAIAMLEQLAANDGWSAFGVIAAEADLAAL